MQLNSSCHFLDPKHCSNELQSIPFIDMELNIVMLLFIKKKKKNVNFVACQLFSFQSPQNSRQEN